MVLLAKVLSSQGKEKEGASLMWKAYKINPNNEEVKIFTNTMKKLMDEVLKSANLNVLKGRYKTGENVDKKKYLNNLIEKVGIPSFSKTAKEWNTETKEFLQIYNSAAFISVFNYLSIILNIIVLLL